LFDTAHLPNMMNILFTMEVCKAARSEADEEVQ
jgi:hypothetical protein